MSIHTTNDVGLQYPDYKDQQWHIPIQNSLAQLEAQAPLKLLDVRPTEIPSTTLNVRIAAGWFRASTGLLVSYAGLASLAIPTGTTKWLWLDETGTLQQGSAFPNNGTWFFPLAIVAAGPTTITSVTDQRWTARSIGGFSNGALQARPAETPSASLNIAVAPGVFWAAGLRSLVSYAGTSSFAIAASSTRFVWLTEAGTLTVGAAFPTTGYYFPIAQVVAGSSTLTSVTDQRPSAASVTPAPYPPTVLTDGATITIDPVNGRDQIVTIAGNRALVLANSASLPWDQIKLTIKQDGSGSRTITSWPSGSRFAGGVAPTLSTVGNKEDVFVIEHRGSADFRVTTAGQGY